MYSTTTNQTCFALENRITFSPETLLFQAAKFQASDADVTNQRSAAPASRAMPSARRTAPPTSADVDVNVSDDVIVGGSVDADAHAGHLHQAAVG